MDAKICDRCGNPIEGNSYRRIHSARMNGWKCVPVTYELCMDCFANLVKFMGEKSNGQSFKKGHRENGGLPKVWM